MTYNSCESDQLGQKSKYAVTSFLTFKTTISVDWSQASFVIRALWRSCGQQLLSKTFSWLWCWSSFKLMSETFPADWTTGTEKRQVMLAWEWLRVWLKDKSIWRPSSCFPNWTRKQALYVIAAARSWWGELTEFRFPLNWTQHSPQVYSFVGNNHKTQKKLW